MITDIVSSCLTVISFLIGTSSFVLGLYVPYTNKIAPAAFVNYYKYLIIALLFPSIILIGDGIYLVISSGIYNYYLMIFVLLFGPVIVILILTLKG